MWQDVRLALRRMRRNPLFALSAAGTLAIGVAATTSIYSVVDGVLLKPLPFPDARSLVRISSDYQALGVRDVGLSLPELEDFARRAGVFQAVAGIWPISANLTGSERPERVEVLLTGANYFDLLGVHAAVGRTYTPRDEVPGIATVAVISDGLWRRGFGGDPRVIGRTLRIDEDVYEVIGVLPPAFRHPSATLETDVEVWAPAGWKALPFSPPGYSARFIASAIGRLAPGVSPDDGAARLGRLAETLATEHPDDYPARLGWTPRVRPLGADLVANVRPALVLLMAAIVCVLLIAVSNISNLLLVRAVEREREVAIQRALGASRVRVITSLLVEGAVLALAGGAAGFLASLWGVDVLLRLVPDRLPRVADIRVDERVFLFALLVSLVAGLLVGLAPALQSARTDVIERLKASGRGLQTGARARVRNALVVLQVAVAFILLSAAALLVRSLWNVQTVDTGMRIDRLLTARLWLPQPNDPASGPYFDHAKRVVVMRAILDRLEHSADIDAAGVTTALPATSDSGTTSFAVEGWTPDRRDLAAATPVSVTPGYFGALGITLVSGRLLQDSDDTKAPRVVVVNETFARAYFDGADPVGRRFRFVGRRGQIPANAPWVTIVGVVRDAKEDGLDAAIRPELYQSLWQASPLNLALVVRGRNTTPSLGTVRAAVWDADPGLPIYAVRTGDELVAAQLSQRLFATRLINVFAGAALFLAAFGLHGVIAYGVRQRTREIGIRVALGATAFRVVALVLRQAAQLTTLGILLGLAGAAALSRLIATMLFEARVSDPSMIASVVIVLATVVGLATFGAARRATRIEAAVALRQD
jgi:predicted permease